MERFFGIATIAAAFALALGGAAQAASVTTDTYDATSTDSDIRKSCNALDVNNAGTLSGQCNKDENGSVTYVSTTHDLTDTVVCSNNTKEPAWRANVPSSDTADYTALTAGQAKSVNTGTLADAYYLIVECEAGKDYELPLSRRLRNKTSEGAFEHASDNLW